MENSIEGLIRKHIEEKCDVDLSDPIDKELSQYWEELDRTLGSIIYYRKEMEETIEEIRLNLKKIQGFLHYCIMLSANLEAARSEMREIHGKTISGKSVAEDLVFITGFYNADLTNVVSVSIRYFRKLCDDFRSKYGSKQGKHRHLTVWHYVSGTPVREDIVHINGAWCNLSGKPLRFVDGGYETPHGAIIRGSEIHVNVNISKNGGQRFIQMVTNSWVSYNLDEILNIGDVPAEHSDKKRCAGGD